MALTVLSVAYPLAPVGRDAVGGAEQVLSMIDEALVAAGHRSLVVGCEGSRCHGELVTWGRADGLLDEAVKARARAECARAVDRVLATERVDVVHLHGVDFHHYLPPAGVPALVTLHLPLAWYPEHVFRLTRPRTHLHCVSASQRRTAPPHARLLDEIPNGVPLGTFEPRAKRKRFALALGRICPEKGFHLALDACRRARVPLLIGGEVFRYEAHERYFFESIVPRLGAYGRYVGPLDRAHKERLLASARCLIVSSVVAETSSLVAMEAFACGTPVVAFRAGALEEIVRHGETGLLVKDVDEMAAALTAVERRIDGAACRRAAETELSAAQMTARYLARYAWLAAGGDREEARGRAAEAEATRV